MTLYGTSVLVTDRPVRGRLVNADAGAIPVLSFVPILDGVFDIQPTGTPEQKAAWLRQLAEQASDLAIRVERHAAQAAAFASYEVAEMSKRIRKPCLTCGGDKGPGAGLSICAACKEAQFWVNVNKTATCWLWTGHTHIGYGRYDGRGAHRVAYELTVGPIPADLELDHLCRTPACVNPSHLEPVTRDENIRRRYETQVTCLRDHEFTPENTYIDPRGRRTCIACRRMRVKQMRLERKAAA